MDGVIRKWGNSLAVRLPKAAIQQAAFGPDQRVRLTATRDRIVIERAQGVDYDLDDLVGGITRANLHGEVDFGPAVGRETL